MKTNKTTKIALKTNCRIISVSTTSRISADLNKNQMSAKSLYISTSCEKKKTDIILSSQKNIFLNNNK
jgi:hypothetical protein